MKFGLLRLSETTIMIKKQINIFFIIVLISISISGYAQKVKPVRLEVPSSIDVETFSVEPLGEEGVLIFYESNEISTTSERKWYFGLFDTSLKQNWLKFIPLPDKLEHLDTRRHGNNLYLFFRNLSRGPFQTGVYEIIHYNINTGEFNKVSGSFPDKAGYAGFDVIGNTGCLALNLDKNMTDVVFIDLTSGDIKPRHIEEGSESYISKVYADKKNNKFYLSVKSMRDKRYMTEIILRFSESGEMEKELIIKDQQNLKMLGQFVFVPVTDNKLRIFGTYDMITGRQASVKDLGDDDDEANSAGLFYVEFENDVQTKLTYLDFLSFENIYASLGNRSVEYTKSGKPQAKTDSKTLSAFYYMWDPQVLKLNDQYVFSVEVYKPYYRSETRMDYDYYGRPSPYTYNIFGGYDYYDVIVAGLSEDGKLIWNNDFALKDLKTYTLARHSVVFSDDDFVSMAYVNKGKIFLQTIEGMIDIGHVETDIETKIAKDRVVDDEYNYITNWYDNYFLVYGYQKIRNRTLGDQNIRTAFYINKVAYN